MSGQVVVRSLPRLIVIGDNIAFCEEVEHHEILYLAHE